MTKQITQQITQQEIPHLSAENLFTKIDWQTMQVLLSCTLEKTTEEAQNFSQTKESFLEQDNLRIIAILILLLSRFSQMGKMHLRLSTWAHKKIIDEYPSLPKLQELKNKLEKFYQEGGKKIITKKDNLLKPIVWHDDHLYFSKNLFFEKTIANEIENRTAYNKKNNPQSNILKNRITIIDGGPGSGKTTLILGLVACLLAQSSAEDENPSIKLLAPTGKATNRLKQSLINSLVAVKKNTNFFADLPIFSKITDFAFFSNPNFLKKLQHSINDMEIETLHRFLNIKPGYTLDSKNKDLSKSYDYLIIDEASMISPTLLARLFLSIRHDAKLIMLGDRHQLSSVDGENLIAYLIKNFSKNFSKNFPKQPEHPTQLDKTLIDLSLIDLSLLRQNKNYRFSSQSSIAITADALKSFMNSQITEISKNDEKTSASISSLIDVFERESKKNDGFTWHSHLGTKSNDENHLPKMIAEHLKKSLVGHYLEFSKLLKKTKNQIDRHHKLFEHFFKKMILTSHRHGPLGQKAISSFVEREIIKAKNLFDTDDPYHEGRVVLFLNNDYDNQIMNGDIGIILKDKVGFAKFHLYLSSRTIPVYAVKPEAMETLYALTIHKSQGSEFDETYLIFSKETHEENPFFSFLSPNLLYTAITRSKKNTTLYLDKTTLKHLLTAKDYPIIQEK